MSTAGLRPRKRRSLIYSQALFFESIEQSESHLTTHPIDSSGALPRKYIQAAVQCLRNGGVAAVPTDTLYGLAADAFNAEAIERVFAIKERPEGMALPVLLAGADQLAAVVNRVPAAAEPLAEAHWPGPLTLILERNEALPTRLTAGGATVAVRVPAHPVPLELARLLGRPITGTSANISGAPDPRTLEELRQQVGNRVDCLIEEGPAPAGTASTIVDLSDGEPRLVREGAIPFTEIERLLGSH